VIPVLVDLGAGAPWKVMPPGIHDASLAEIAARFATTPHRRWLFGGFQRVTQALRNAGCSVVFLDGSFTTDKSHPGDFDGCWDHIVALTLRHDRLDNFWFTLFHEIGHLKLHIGEATLIAIFDDTEMQTDSHVEREY
jgi:hypothetical protein